MSKTADETHRVKVVGEGDTASLDKAFSKSAAKAKTLEVAVVKVNAQLEKNRAIAQNTADRFSKFDAAVTRANASTNASVGAFGKGGAAARAFGIALKSADAGTVSFKQGIMATAAAFGPLGFAIGVVAGALVGIAEDQYNAAKAADEHTLALKRQKSQTAEVARIEALRIASEKTAAQHDREYTASRQKEIDSRADELKGLEDTFAQFGRGKDSIAMLKREAEIRADNLAALGDHVGAAETLRSSELEILGILGQQEKAQKSITNEKEKQHKWDENRRLKVLAPTGGRHENIGFNTRAEERAYEEFQGELGLARGAAANDSGMQRAGSDTRALAPAQARQTATLRSIDIERAGDTTGEGEITRIERERDARLELLQVQQDAATLAAERSAIGQEMEQVSHDATLARIDAEIAAEDRRLAKRQSTAEGINSIASSSIGMANFVAKASGASAAKQEKIAGRLAGVQAMFVGGVELVKAAAAFASFNYVQGAAHTAAGIFGLAQGAVMMAGGLPSGASGSAGSGGGGSIGSGGGSQTPRGGTMPGGDSPIPGSPGPQTPSVGGGGGGTTKVIHMNFHGDHYGTPRREFIRTIRDGINEDAGERRPRFGGVGT